MPEILEANYCVVTPMFNGGADQNADDGIRPPSVKGALRFWWRALSWSRFLKSAARESEALRALHREEARLFGIAADDDGSGGQGCFLMRIEQGSLRTSRQGPAHEGFKNRAAARYLGYGLMEAFGSRNKGTEAGQLTRSCIDDGQGFKVRLIFRGAVEGSVKQALIAWGLLGGLGSRSRHGFGSVALTDLKVGDKAIWKPPLDRKSYQKAISELLAGNRDAPAYPPYTAMAQEARVDILVAEMDASLDALNDFGKCLLMYRSWGKGGKVLGQDSEMNFAQDHAWSKGTRPSGFHPKRVVFGLPHNYAQGTNMEVKPENHERRASPLLFHVHPVGDRFLGVSILMPAVFLPIGERIKAGGELVPSKPDWTVLSDFLDGTRRADGRPRFAGKSQI